jgi:hypothetical protein
MCWFAIIGRLMDAEILGGANYTALDLLRDMRKGIWKGSQYRHNRCLFIVETYNDIY